MFTNHLRIPKRQYTSLNGHNHYMKTTCEKEFFHKLRKEYNYFNDNTTKPCCPSSPFYVNENDCNVLVQKQSVVNEYKECFMQKIFYIFVLKCEINHFKYKVGKISQKFVKTMKLDICFTQYALKNSKQIKEVITFSKQINVNTK